MKISPGEFRAQLPLPATNSWPEGVWDIEDFTADLATWAVFWGPDGGE